MERTREGIVPCLVLHLGRADARMTREGIWVLFSFKLREDRYEDDQKGCLRSL